MRRLRGELDEMLSLAASGEIFTLPPLHDTPPALRRLNDVAFSGDGEPTLFAGIGDACRVVAKALARHGLLETKIVLITNATLLHLQRVKDALTFLDSHRGEIWAKLDSGVQFRFERISRSRTPLPRVLANILTTARARPIVIQSMFMKIHGLGPRRHEIDAYLDCLEQLINSGAQIKFVQVYTVARSTAEMTVTALGDDELDRIAGQVRSRGLKAEAFYGLAPQDSARQEAGRSRRS
jgi:wyosine [tRNA(Phe)-imidazoG37] synthetase (radical SAM superfamily)